MYRSFPLVFLPAGIWFTKCSDKCSLNLTKKKDLFVKPSVNVLTLQTSMAALLISHLTLFQVRQGVCSLFVWLNELLSSSLSAFCTTQSYTGCHLKHRAKIASLFSSWLEFTLVSKGLCCSATSDWIVVQRVLQKYFLLPKT